MGHRRELTRREFIKGSLGAGAVALAAACAPAAGPAPTATPAKVVPKLKSPIKIGGQAILSGPLGAYGDYMRKGSELAAEEINKAGGIAGSQVEVEFRDEELKPDTSVKNARYFVDSWGADFLIGIDSSGDVLAVGEIMPQLDKVLIVTHAATEKLNEQLVYKKGIKQIFRISVPVYQDAIAGALVAKDLKVKRWATISPDYEYGHTSWNMFQEYLKKSRPDVEFVGEAWAKFGTVDFSSQISSVMATNPEAIFSTEWAGEAVTLIKQAKLFGVFEKTKEWMTGMGAAVDVLKGLGKDYPDGAWASCRYWFLYPDTPENKAFVEKFRKRWDDYPSYPAETSYSAVYAIKAAVEKAGSIKTGDVVKALEGMTLETPAGKRYIRPEDHQAVYQVPWGRIIHDPKYPMPILTDLKVFPADAYYRKPPFKT